MKTKHNYMSYSFFIVIIVALAQFASTYPQFQLPPIQNTIIKQVNLSQSQYVQCFTAPMVPAVLLCLVGGFLVDKFGAKAVIGIALLLSTIGTFSRLFAMNYPLFFLAMAFTGIAPAMIHCSAAKIMGQWFSKERISFAIGIAMLGGNIANFVATSTTALFPSPRTAYLFSGLLCGASIFLWILKFKNGNSTKTTTLSASVSPVKLSSFKLILSCKTVWLVSLCMMFLMGFYMTVVSSTPSALQSIGRPRTLSSILAAFISIGAPLGCILGSTYALKSKNYKHALQILILITMAVFPWAWRSSYPFLSALAFFLTGFCYGTCQVTIMSIPARLPEIGQTYAATAGGLLSTIQMIGAILIPSKILVPLAGGNYLVLFGLAGGMLLLSLLTLTLVTFHQKSSI